jgi:endogenous inhibitor of DNA gyrase (YacG/DUF329 family)
MTTSQRRRGGASCPVCGKASAPKAREGAAGKSPFPFCSVRCRSVDLGNWLDERYRLDDDLSSPSPVRDAQD